MFISHDDTKNPQPKPIQEAAVISIGDPCSEQKNSTQEAIEMTIDIKRTNKRRQQPTVADNSWNYRAMRI